jgi:hypothetical protein
MAAPRRLFDAAAELHAWRCGKRRSSPTLPRLLALAGSSDALFDESGARR